MSWKEVELVFNRALQYTFSRRKLLFTVPVLIFCGLIIVFCRTLAASSGNWIALSMSFLPTFICAPILFAAGIILTRIYHHEVKGMPASYRRTFRLSKELMLEVATLAVPVVLVYLVLWTLLGLFYLVKGIPYVGEGLGLIFSFGPFLLLLGSLLLSVLSVSTLFFVTPPVALKSVVKKEVVFDALKRLRTNPFSNIALMLLGLVPLLFVTGLMSIAAVMTGTSYVVTGSSLGVCLQWFFIMIPFGALLTPAVIFFFNFAAESHVLMLKKMQDDSCGSLS